MLSFLMNMVDEFVMDLLLLDVDALHDQVVSADDLAAQILLADELVFHVLDQTEMVLAPDIVPVNQLFGFLSKLALFLSDFFHFLSLDSSRLVEVTLIESQSTDPLLVLDLIDLANGVDPLYPVLELLVVTHLFS